MLVLTPFRRVIIRRVGFVVRCSVPEHHINPRDVIQVRNKCGLSEAVDLNSVLFFCYGYLYSRNVGFHRLTCRDENVITIHSPTRRAQKFVLPLRFYYFEIVVTCFTFLLLF